MSGWSPIATAPKDGTRILVFCRGESMVAHWVEDIYHCWGVPSPVSLNQNDRGTFSNISANDFTARIGDVGPTHWMPLPKAPTP